MNRWSAAASALALCLGLVLIVGARPVRPEAVLPRAVAAETTTPAPSSTAVDASPTATPAPTIAPGYRITIPRLGIDLPIAEGDVDRDAVRQETPENLAFHLPRSALPGSGGNTYLYAHARRGMFLALWNARDGDAVMITTPDARQLRYVVTEVHARVDPTDVSWTAPTNTERLTLQTSTGPDPGDPRFVVIALPV